MSNGAVVASVSKLPLGTSVVCCGGYLRDVKKRDTTSYIFCTGGDLGLHLWELDPFSGEMEQIRIGGDSKGNISRCITDCSFTLDRDFIIAATTSGDYLVVSVKHKRIVRVVEACKKGLNSVVTLPNGVLTGGGDATVNMFDHEGVVVGSCQVDGAVLGMSCSTDYVEVILSTTAGTVYRLNVATMQHITISEAHTDSVVAVAFSPGNSERLGTASMDGTCKVWDLAEYTVISTARPLKGQERGAYPTCIGMSDVMLSGWSDGRVLAHDIFTGENLWSIDQAHVGGVSAITISHNNRFILSGGPSGEVRLWELRSRDLVSHFKEHTASVNAIVLFEDDSMALSVSRDRCILKWDLRLERRVHAQMQRMGGINDVVISKDGTHTLTVGQEKCLKYWRVDEESESHTVALNDDADEGHTLALSHDGRIVATGGSEGVVRLWNYDSGSAAAQAGGHSEGITSIKFSPDDRQVVSGGDDGCIFIWNVFTEQ
jgi:WD40 repeat protein